MASHPETPETSPPGNDALPTSAPPAQPSSSTAQFGPSGPLTLDKPLPIKPPFKFRKDTFVRTDLSDLLDDLLGADHTDSRPAAPAHEPAGIESGYPAVEAEFAPMKMPPLVEQSDFDLPRSLDGQSEAAQYVNFQILDAVDSDERPLELHEGLYCGLEYKLVVSMDVTADPRFATGEQEKIERPPAGEVVLDVVLALELNFEILNEGWATLEWPKATNGPSVFVLSVGKRWTKAKWNNCRRFADFAILIVKLGAASISPSIVARPNCLTCSSFFAAAGQSLAHFHCESKSPKLR
jgi:hypothetical protein